MQRQDNINRDNEQTQANVDFVALAENINAILDEINRLELPIAAAASNNTIPTPPDSLASSTESLSSADSSSSSTIISLPAAPPSAEQPHNDCNINVFCLIPYLPSLASAAKDAAGDALSLFQAGNKSLPLLITASTVAFLAAFELSGQSTTENLKELTNTIRTRRKPSDWPALSTRKIFAVTSVAAMMAAWCAFSESAQAYDFVGTIGSDYKITTSRGMKITWSAITIGATAGSGITKLLTDNYETWKVMWRLSSGESTPYANRASRLLTPTVGGFFATLKAFHDSVQAYSVIKEIFAFQSIPAKSGLALACTTDMVSNFCFSGLAVTNQMDELFRYAQKPKFEPAKITAFTMSLALAIFLSYVKRTLNMGFYQDLATQDFGLKDGTIPNPVFETLSWLILISEVMLVTASLNPQMMHWVGHIFDKVGSLLNRMTQPCRTPSTTGDYPPAVWNLDNTNDSAPLLAAEAGKASEVGLFAQRPAAAPVILPDNDELRIPSRHRRTGCPPCTLI